MSNPYEQRARLEKATAIVDRIVALSGAGEAMSFLREHGSEDAIREALGTMAGVNTPSERTIETVLYLLEQRERTFDPFEGLS